MLPRSCVTDPCQWFLQRKLQNWAVGRGLTSATSAGEAGNRRRGWAAGRGHQCQGTRPDHEQGGVEGSSTAMSPRLAAPSLPHALQASPWLARGAWSLELGTCHTPCLLPCSHVAQQIEVGAEKPLGEKHVTPEPHTQPESSTLETTGRVECGGPQKAFRRKRGAPRTRNPTQRQASVVLVREDLCTMWQLL